MKRLAEWLQQERETREPLPGDETSVSQAEPGVTRPEVMPDWLDEKPKANANNSAGFWLLFTKWTRQPLGWVVTVALLFTGLASLFFLPGFKVPTAFIAVPSFVAFQALEETIAGEEPLEEELKSDSDLLVMNTPDVLPNFNRSDPFEPLVGTTAKPESLDPLTGLSFMGMIKGDTKTPDVVILEKAGSGPNGLTETIIKPLGSRVENNGLSIYLKRATRDELFVTVDGEARTLTLVEVVDAASGSANGTQVASAPPAGGANPPSPADPNGQQLLDELDE